MEHDASSLRRILTQCRTIAVVGLSDDPTRPSHGVARYMQQHGYRIIGVNPVLAARGTPVLGQVCYASLRDITEPVDMVNVFRRTETVEPLAQEAIALGARCFWQQLGVANAEAIALVIAAGLDSVHNRCLEIEHMRLQSDR